MLFRSSPFSQLVSSVQRHGYKVTERHILSSQTISRNYLELRKPARSTLRNSPRETAEGAASQPTSTRAVLRLCTQVTTRRKGLSLCLVLLLTCLQFRRSLPQQKRPFQATQLVTSRHQLPKRCNCNAPSLETPFSIVNASVSFRSQTHRCGAASQSRRVN